jgi:hypothetical protein
VLALSNNDVPLVQWLKILVQLPMRTHAIYSSGDESVHALLRVEAHSKDEWDQSMRRTLLPRLAPLGVDPGALTAVHLSRDCLAATEVLQGATRSFTTSTLDRRQRRCCEGDKG